MHRCPDRPVKTRGPPHGQGGAAHIEPTSHGPRPGLAHHIFEVSRPWPARPINFSKFSDRPGPAHHIFEILVPAHRNFQIGPARPGPDQQPMTSPVKNVYIWLEESQEQFQVSYGMICMWESYTLLPLLNSSCGATRYTWRNRHNQDHHTESHSVTVSCPPAKKGSPIRRKRLTTNLVRVDIARARVLESHVLIVFTSCCCCKA